MDDHRLVEIAEKIGYLRSEVKELREDVSKLAADVRRFHAPWARAGALAGGFVGALSYMFPISRLFGRQGHQ